MKRDSDAASGFSVDTKLFRELGELLVGRDSTALVELIKNAYDADATEVAIFGRSIAAAEGAGIVVTDDGVGMSPEEFSRGFLRIASRSRTGAVRRSPWFERRYTGEKGIGRLAAHKLARRLEVVSRRWSGAPRDALDGFPANGEVTATIDWDAIEELETLDEIAGSGAVEVRSRAGGGRAGTKLTLAPLRKAWTERDRARFFDEVATLTPAKALLDPPHNAFMAPPLLKSLKLRDERRSGDFAVKYLGDLAMSEGDLPASADGASWMIEIECDARDRLLKIAVAPTRKTREEYANAEPFFLRRELDEAAPAIGFQARIFQLSNGQWQRRYQGVRVYYEGFRVLPYGDVRDDWLELDRDYRSRGHNELGRLKHLKLWDLPPGTDKEGLAIQGNAAFFGAVLLTRAGADDLQMLANREGFLPGPKFDFVSDTVRLAIDLQVRLRYAATSEAKQARRTEGARQQRAARTAASGQSPSAFLLREMHETAHAALSDARSAMAAGRTVEARATLIRLEETMMSARDLSDEVSSEATMFRVLASMGLEQAAFVHEVRNLAQSSGVLADALERVAADENDRRKAGALRSLAADAREIRERLRRNAIYLADVTGVEGRRRRGRLKLRERTDRVLGFYERAISRRRIGVANDIADDLETPPMFPAELTAILSNLLGNAVKFAGIEGRVAISADVADGILVVRIENTGDAVDVSTSDKWFEPFRSTTAEVDESLGQGMGLGLTITRSLLDEYGGAIGFARPSAGYASAIEWELPKR